MTFYTLSGRVFFSFLFFLVFFFFKLDWQLILVLTLWRHLWWCLLDQLIVNRKGDWVERPLVYVHEMTWFVVALFPSDPNGFPDGPDAPFIVLSQNAIFLRVYHVVFTLNMVRDSKWIFAKNFIFIFTEILINLSNHISYFFKVTLYSIYFRDSAYLPTQ